MKKIRTVVGVAGVVATASALAMMACSDEAGTASSTTPPSTSKEAGVTPTDAGTVLTEAGTGAETGTAGSVPTSCVGGGPGVDDCGPNQDQSCCDIVSIPGGAWNRRSDPNFPATIKPYKLDRYEVTVGRFKKFLEAGEGIQSAASHYPAHYGAVPGDTIGGWDPAYAASLPLDRAALELFVSDDSSGFQPTYSFADKTYPMSQMSWYLALLFCAWDGGFLPTETMWLKEAENGDENRIYPWTANLPDGGPVAEPTIADSWICPSGSGGPALLDFVCDGKPRAVRVWEEGGSRSKHGLLNLAGNVVEWFQDWGGRVAVSDGDGGTTRVRAPMTMPCDANAAGAVNGCPRQTPDFSGGTLAGRGVTEANYLFPNNITIDDAGTKLKEYGLLSTRTDTRAAYLPDSSPAPWGLRCARP